MAIAARLEAIVARLAPRGRTPRRAGTGEEEPR